ncbi:MAG: 50S ribosomal protein L6 [Desulfobacterales bacterium]|nr:50S ribosomal protein L6 [Desulfobacterales bacterium]
MSRVGKKPIQIPEKTTITYKDRVLSVQGQKGTLSMTVHPDAALDITDSAVTVSVKRNDQKAKAIWGMTRALIANMVHGVNQGFERVLEINGVGYRAELKDKGLEFHLGHSHPIYFELPEGISAKVEKNVIRLEGYNKELLGYTASSIRQLRPPEPYKGKGVKYAEETIQRKAGKTAK